MKTSQLNTYRELARPYLGKHKSAAIILELCDEVDRWRNLYSICLDAAYKQGRGRGSAIGKLKRMVVDELTEA